MVLWPKGHHEKLKMLEEILMLFGGLKGHREILEGAGIMF